MADTASLIARVKTEGVAQADAQLDSFSASAASAESASDKLTTSTAKTGIEVKKIIGPLSNYNSEITKLSAKITTLESAQEKLATENSQLTSQVNSASSAMSSQAKQIDSLKAKIDELSNGAKKVPQAVNAASSSFGSARNAAQQVGFQVQDMVVQLQSGTSAFVAIGQQGSQLAGAFGPGGAVLGAVIALASAIGGVLYKSIGDSTKSTDELDKTAKALASSFQQSKNGTLEFSDALVALSQSGDLAYNSTVKLLGLQADKQVDEVTKAIKSQGEALLGNSVAGQTNTATLDDLIAKNADVAKTLDSVNVVADAGTGIYANLKAAVGDLAQEYGLGTKEVTDMLVAQRAFNKEPSAENAQKYADATARAAAAAKDNKSELLDQAVALQKNANALATAEKQQDLVTASQNRMGNATNSTTARINEQNAAIVKSAQIATLSDKDRATAMAAVDKEAFAKREGVTKDQIDAYNKARDLEAQQDIARINKTEKDKADALAKADNNRLAAQAKREESQAASQRKAADNFIAGIQRQSGDEIAQINTTEQQKLAELEKFHQLGAAQGQKYEDAKTAIQVNAEAARQEQLAKIAKQKAEKETKLADFTAQIQGQNAVELDLFDIQQKQKEEKAAEFRDGSAAAEEIYQQNLLAIAQNYNKKRRDSYANMLGQTTDDLRSALGEGNKLYKAFAIANAIMNTYQAAVAAYQSASAIPVVGWVLGPVAAGAAVAAGLANVAKIRSAREQGGNLSAGQISTIAERGKPEVIMPASASRVRTAQQMRQIMGDDSSGKSSIPSIAIVNNTGSKIDSVQADQDDEGRLRIIIGETVSGLLMDSNSNVSKSRRATRGQPGY